MFEVQTSLDCMPIEESTLLCYQNSCDAMPPPMATDSSTATDYTLLASSSLAHMLASGSSGNYPTPIDVTTEECELNNSRGQVLSIDTNNQATDPASHMKYICPDLPQGPIDIGPPLHVVYRAQCRMALRPDRLKYVTLNFRVMRRDAEMHVGQIINLCGVRRAELYSPKILDRWTRRLQVKIKAMVKVSLVFKSISARLGLQSTVGIKYCLDGFYGIEAFGDAFGNYGAGICPWMEVCGDGTPKSLKLEDADNIYISVATEKMIDAVRRRLEQMSDQMVKQAQLRAQPMRASARPSAGIGANYGGSDLGIKRISWDPQESLDFSPDSPFKRSSNSLGGHLPEGLLKRASANADGPALEL